MRGRKLCFIIIVLMACVLLCSGMISIAKEDSSDELGYKYYTGVQIQAGDTLWTIAQEYMPEGACTIHEYIEEIKRINHLKDDTIYEGQRLTVYYYSQEYK